MGCAAPWLTNTAALLAAVTLAGCSHRSLETTSVALDGQTRSITGRIICMAQPDGRLLILVNGKGRDRMRVLLAREGQLVVEKLSLKVGDAHGYNDDSGEMWASKADDVYTINGRVPPSEGETAAHQFVIHARCEREIPQPLPNPGVANGGP